MSDELRPEVIYLAAGHVATGGTRAGDLVEGQENVNVVEDALDWLTGHAGLAQLSAQVYQLAGVPLVVVPHALDLAATIRYVNRDYAERGLSGWQQGVCLEVHFNGPSPTAAGPLVVYDEQFAPSVALADRAASILQRVIGLPCRRWTNQDNLRSRGFAYGFIVQTAPLALLLEMDELHNAARAAIVRDNIADNVYGEALGRVVAELAGMTSIEPEPDPGAGWRTWIEQCLAEHDRRLRVLETATPAPEFGPATTAGIGLPTEATGVAP